MNGSLSIFVTGEHLEPGGGGLPTSLGARPLEWISLPVLEFRRLPVPHEILRRCVDDPFGWIVFSSPRGVEFWSESLIENQIDFPLETQVACMGEGTATAAEFDGFTPDFFPTEPGTEGFLSEFESLLVNNLIKPSILLPSAENGRTALREKLAELGCEIVWFALYQTKARKDLKSVVEKIHRVESGVLVFTSPSSVDALLDETTLPPAISTVVAMGEYTADRLRGRGLIPRILPSADLSRLQEIL